MRKSRKICPDVPYHVTARANRQEFILESKEIKDMLLIVIKRAKGKFRFSITNFCVMNNHFHFIITPGRGEHLSRIMQWILSVFALQYNRKFGYKGHVWYDRFKSWIINGLRQLLIIFRYIAENPVRAGIVIRPWDYAFNGVTHIRDHDHRVVEDPGQELCLMMPEYCTPLLLS
jgi:putative transposase